jgi:hypothetical protein
MSTYRIRNWAEYNRALKNRANLTIWISEEAREQWLNQKHTGRKGRPRVYSDDAILCALMVRSIFNLPLRALEGFLLSIFQMLGVNLPVPSYSQISRRSAALGKVLVQLSKRRPTDLVFDSTGFKVYGEGEWKVRQHGSDKRRIWRKLHVALDPHSQEIILADLTTSAGTDASTGVTMLKKASKRLSRVFGDGAYDSQNFRRAAHSKGAQVIVPPRRTARHHSHSNDPVIQARNHDLEAIRGLGPDGRKIWKILRGYHLRSLVETTMFRLKQLFSGSLRSRCWDRQVAETRVRCLVLNRMTQLGMPKGEWIHAA